VSANMEKPYIYPFRHRQPERDNGRKFHGHGLRGMNPWNRETAASKFAVCASASETRHVRDCPPLDFFVGSGGSFPFLAAARSKVQPTVTLEPATLAFRHIHIIPNVNSLPGPFFLRLKRRLKRQRKRQRCYRARSL
jgi:hypothetical protein